MSKLFISPFLPYRPHSLISTVIKTSILRRLTPSRCTSFDLNRDFATSTDEDVRSTNPRLKSHEADLKAYKNLKPGIMTRCRLSDYYDDHLSSDMLYMTYQLPAGYAMDGSTPHTSHGRAITQHPDPLSQLPQWDPNDPYTRNRPPRPPKGGTCATPRRPAADTSPDHAIHLQKISIDIHVPESIHTKKELLGAIYLLQLITGQPDRTGLSADGLACIPSNHGIQLSKTKDASTTFRVRRGMTCGVHVDLRGPEMFNFMDVLVTFVLPRLKDYNGFKLPPHDVHQRYTSMVSGTVQLGLPSSGMGLWPGIEESLENWPRRYGMNIHFVTNATGPGASDKASVEHLPSPRDQFFFFFFLSTMILPPLSLIQIQHIGPDFFFFPPFFFFFFLGCVCVGVLDER